MAKVNLEAYTADDYEKYEHAEHILNVPDTYLGSIEKQTKEEWIFNKDKMEKAIISLPEGMSRLFLEILSNACDSTSRFKLSKGGNSLIIPPIDVKMTTDEITITNYGHKGGINLIPIEINTKTQMYAPAMIFGSLLTSSNYDKKKIRLGAGRNGYGAKLVNIFSKLFKIVIVDHSRHLKYTQTWEKNMEIRNEPIIEECENDHSSVSVSYSLDFKRFGYTKYPEEAFKLFRRYCCDFSLGGKIPIKFNNQQIDCSDIKNFSKLYFSDDILETSILNKSYPIRPPEGMDKKTAMIFPESEFMIIYTPEKGTFISIVNGLMTKDGGVHVDTAYKKISELLMPKINTEKAKAKISMADVKQHITIILSCRLQDPTYSSQSKNCLTKPVPNLEIEKNNISKFMSWKLIEDLEAVLKFKEKKELKKTDGKKVRHTGVAKIEDANFAGTDQSHKCTLILIEGDSAESYATATIDILPNGKDYYGTYPLKGKVLNVRNASLEKILENKEIANIKKALGLREEVNYLQDENYFSLRYGQVYIMVDADVDGKHIAGLLYNFFDIFYPTLLERGFVKYYRTPILRITGPKIKEIFYNEYDFKKWRENRPENYTVEYYKGLGSSSNQDIKEDATRIIITKSIYDKLAPKNLILAFDNQFSNPRKEWIENWAPKGLSLETQKEMEISDFINEEFITFSIANVERALPSLYDGLKVSQRKLLWTLLSKYNGYNKNMKKVKTAEFASSTSAYTNYHHGEKSLCETINGMTWDFVGSNNMPYFSPEGQFGRRNKGGKDAASERYTYVKSIWWLKYIFKEEDLPILKFVEDEGSLWEPENFLPILPMALINGSLGIATGYSTFIPCHNPLDLCKWIKNRLILGSKLPIIKPWYKGFTGTIEFKNIDAEVLREKMLEDDPEFILPESGKLYSMICKGKYEVVEGKKEKNIKILEIPIGRWYADYKIKFIDKLLETKSIKDYRVMNRKNSPDNEYDFFGVHPNFEINHKNLGLEKPFYVGNMVLLNEKKRPKKFKTVEEILESFFVYRLGKYSERKENRILQIRKEIEKLKNKIRFIRCEIEGKIVIRKTKREVVLKNMEILGFDKELLTSCNIGSFTDEGIIELEEKVSKLEKEKTEIESISVESMWTTDIDDFLKEYKKHY